MAVSKRSASAGGWRKTLLWLAVMACPGLACKSPGAAGEPHPSQATQASPECPAELLLPQPTATFTLNCVGFTPKAQKLHVNSQVTFVSACDDKVFISFSDPKTLFTSGVESIVLEHRGDSRTETTTSAGTCHQMCFNSLTCPPPDDVDSKTGSLDVYTSGGTKPDSSKVQSP